MHVLAYTCKRGGGSVMNTLFLLSIHHACKHDVLACMETVPSIGTRTRPRQPRWKNSKRTSTLAGRCQAGRACSSKGNERLRRPRRHSTSKVLKKRSPGKQTKGRSQTRLGIVTTYRHINVRDAANSRTILQRKTLKISPSPPNATRVIADTPGMMARQ